MNLLAALRKTASDVRVQIKGVQAEIELLEEERASLEAAPIRFDCWRKAMLRAIDIQAERVPNEMTARWRRRLTQNDGHRYAVNYPMTRFVDTGELAKAAPFFGAGIASDKNDAGLELGWLLVLMREEIKAAFAKSIEPLRSTWPADRECGPEIEKRKKRLAVIEEQLDKLIAERDEALEIVGEISATEEPDDDAG